MTTDTSSPRLKNLVLISLLVMSLLLLWLTALLMLPSNPMDGLPGRDNGVFLYGGQQILLGRIPYVDFWDHKGPMIHYINALGLSLGSDSRWGVWGIEFLFLFSAGMGIYLVAKEQWGWMVAFFSLAAWSYGIYTAGPYHHFKDSNFTEIYSLPLNVYSVYVWTQSFKPGGKKWHFIVIGILTGFNFMLRPNNIGIQTAIVLVEILRSISKKQLREALKKCGLMMLGGISVLSVFVLFFLLNNALFQFIDSVFVYNMIYSHNGNLSFWKVVLNGLSVYSGIPLIAYFIVSIFFIFSSREISSSNRDVRLLLLIGCPIEMILTSLSGRALLHYYITWIPYLSWLIGCGASFLYPQKIKESHALAVSALTLVLLAVTNLYAVEKCIYIASHLFLKGGDEIEKKSSIAGYIEQNTNPDDEVLVWGNEVWINFYSRRSSPTKYAYLYPLFMPGYTNKTKVIAFLNDIEDSPPKFIIEPMVNRDVMLPLNQERRRETAGILGMPMGMEQVFEFIDQNYCATLKIRDITIYEIKQNGIMGSCNSTYAGY